MYLSGKTLFVKSSLVFVKHVFIPLSDVWDGAWFTVGPPVSLLPLLGFLDGRVFFASIEDVFRDVPPFDDPFDLRVGGVFFLQFLAVLNGRLLTIFHDAKFLPSLGLP